MADREIDPDRLAGVLMATNHLLEHTWAYLLFKSSDPVASTRTMRDKVLADFDLPQEGAGTEERFLTNQYALAFLEEFWKRVEFRAHPDRKKPND